MVMNETSQISLAVLLVCSAYLAVHYATRKPVWERGGYGARRYHAVSASVQGLPSRGQAKRPIQPERPNEGTSWDDAGTAYWDETLLFMIDGAKADAAQAARVPVAVCIMTRDQIEDLDWKEAYRLADQELEECAREIDRALTYKCPEAMAIYWECQRRDARHDDAARAGNIAEVLRQDTNTLDILFREIDEHLAAAEQLQAV